MQSMLMLLIVLGCISTVSTIKCYNCNSDDKAGCGNPFDASSLSDAYKAENNNTDVCVKIVLSSKGGESTARNLLLESKSICIGGLEGCDGYESLGKIATVCCCKGDLCNGASALYQPLLMIFLLIIGTFTYGHF